VTLKLGIALAILLLVTAGAVWLYRQGGESVLHSIERQNDAAGDASDQARSDYDRCVHPDSGGVYDFATGKCRRPSTRGRN
jgi:hypothetical protein